MTNRSTPGLVVFAALLAATTIITASLPAVAAESAKRADARAQAAFLDKLADAKARHEAARGNDLLQAMIAKQCDAILCELSKTASHVVGWNGTLTRVQVAGDLVAMRFRLADDVDVLTGGNRNDPIAVTVATMPPGTRVRFGGRLLLGSKVCTSDTSGRIEMIIEFDSIEAVR